MDAARNLKANLKLDGKPCGWCQIGLHLGDDAAVCNTCEKEHHQRCWDGSGGCSTQGCLAAPLRRLDAPVPGTPGFAAPGYPPPGSPFPQGGAPNPYQAAGHGAPQPPPPGYMSCPNCRTAIMVGTQVCPSCRAITTPDGLYHGPKTNAPGAVAALVCGIIGFFVCGLILGIVAISKANAAKRAIEADPTLGGGGMATAGLVLGILDLVAWGILVLIRIGAS